MIFNMTGGGAPLNFKVVGNPQPTNPSENTIWLNTDVPIASWYFQAEQPKNMAHGDVWFLVGTSSTVEFNALKKNGIQVYPLSAKQMVSGALVDKTAKSYQNGGWVEWITIVISPGVDNTGGWVWYNTGSTASAVKNSDGSYTLTRNNNSQAGYFFRTKNTYDLTNVNVFEFELLSNGSAGNIVGIAKPETAAASAVLAGKNLTVLGKNEIDVSAYTGKYAIAANMEYTNGWFTIANIKLR